MNIEKLIEELKLLDQSLLCSSCWIIDKDSDDCLSKATDIVSGQSVLGLGI